MPTTFCVPGCQQKGRNSSAGENVWFFRFLGSPWGENSGSIQFVDMNEENEFAIDRRGGNKFVRCI